MRQSLNFAWRFIDRFETSFIQKMPKDAESIDLPHTIKQLPASYFSERDYQVFGTYEKYFNIAKLTELDTALLVFEGVMVKARVILNGVDLKTFVSAYNRVIIDISEAVKLGDNRLLVIVDAREDKLVPPFGGVVDYLSFGGIYRDVYVDIVPHVYIQNLFVDTKNDGHVSIRYDMVNHLKDKFDLRYEVAINSEIIGRYYEDEFVIENPALWSLETPNIYTIKATLKTKYGTQIIHDRFGFRETKFTPHGFILNGEIMKLRGLNRHQSYPYVGYAMPRSMQALDAEIMKHDLALSITRTSHYPPSQHFINRCDELGLLVMIEIPGWQYIGSDEKWINQFKINLERMVKDYYNHPSIVLWGVRINEGPDHHDLYTWANEFVHSFDRSRQTGGVRNLKHSELLEDVYTYNDFVHEGDNIGIEDPKTIAGKGVPYLVTEYNGHMYPTKVYDDEEHRVNQALRHFRVLDDIYKYEQVSGGIGWVFADYQTHQDFGSADRLCHHGVLDQFRMPKYAASVYASQSNEQPYLEVLSRLQNGDHPKAIIGTTVVASNVDYIELYKNDEFVAKFLPAKKDYPYLPHPPFIIDDYIGNAILKSGRFSRADAKILKQALQLGAIKGFAKLGMWNYSKIGLVMVKNKLKYQDLVNLWYQYVTNWGTELTKFSFKGYRHGEEVISKQLAPSHHYQLDVTSDHDPLIVGDTYDVARISIKLLDEYQCVATYVQEAVTVKVSSELAILGPDSFPLIGGQTACYIRTRILDEGVGKITISTPHYGTIELKIKIKKQL